MRYQMVVLIIFLAVFFAGGVGLVADAGRRWVAGGRR